MTAQDPSPAGGHGTRPADERSAPADGGGSGGRDHRRTARPSGRRRPLTGSLLARRVLGHGATYLVLIVAAALTLGPFLFSVMTALTSTTQFAQEGPLSLPAPP